MSFVAKKNEIPKLKTPKIARNANTHIKIFFVTLAKFRWGTAPPGPMGVTPLYHVSDCFATHILIDDHSIVMFTCC